MESSPERGHIQARDALVHHHFAWGVRSRLSEGVGGVQNGLLNIGAEAEQQLTARS
jgi:hypothetical protein